MKPDTGVQVKTTADAAESLPDLIASLYNPDIAPSVAPDIAEQKLGSMVS